MTTNDVLVLVILSGLLALAILLPTLPDWMTRSRWTGRRMSRRHIVILLTLILVAALAHDLG